MFTTGSKLFIGASVVAVVAAITFGVSYDGDPAWTSAVALIGVSIALIFMMIVNFWVRDSNVGAMQSDALVGSAAAQARPANSMWPVVGALGAALTVLGVVATPVVFKGGITIMLVALFEWLIHNWADRASADRRFNAGVRGRLLHPLEFPVLAAVGLGVVIYSFSRIMLWLSKETGPLVFVVVAALITVGGFLFASKANLRTTVTAGICAVAALGLVGTGAVMAVDGERSIEEFPTATNEPSICSDPEATYADKKGSQTVGAKSNVAATVILNSDLDLYAQSIGLGEYTREVTLPRSNPSHVMFRNLSDTTVRLTANMGAFQSVVNGTTIVDKPVTCTTLVKPGGQQFMTLTFTKSSNQSIDPYTFTVPGVEGTSVLVVVP